MINPIWTFFILSNENFASIVISLNFDIYSFTQENADKLENYYPILKPISASFSAKESFAPSPTNATWCLFSNNYLRYSSTIFLFCSGLHLAYILVYFNNLFLTFLSVIFKITFSNEFPSIAKI